jgi:uncharacterized membrane protein
MPRNIPIAIITEIELIEPTVDIDSCPVRPWMAVITIGWIPL